MSTDSWLLVGFIVISVLIVAVDEVGRRRRRKAEEILRRVNQ